MFRIYMYAAVPRSAPCVCLPSLLMSTFVPSKAEVAEATFVFLTANHVLYSICIVAIVVIFLPIFLLGCTWFRWLRHHLCITLGGCASGMMPMACIGRSHSVVHGGILNKQYSRCMICVT